MVQKTNSALFTGAFIMVSQSISTYYIVQLPYVCTQLLWCGEKKATGTR